jgi:spore coat protein JB
MTKFQSERQEESNLRRRNNEHNGCEGQLPSSAPLANPYVPFQLEDPPKYDARKAIVRGTLYPGLDLPFKGMVNKNELPVTPLTELQTLAFAVQELALYLDTHRDDMEALELYRSYQKMYKNCMEEYNKSHGPMSHRTVTDGPYSWLDDPWPWEYCKNKEA